MIKLLQYQVLHTYHILHYPENEQILKILLLLLGAILFLPFNFKNKDIKTIIDNISNPINKFFEILKGANENIKNVRTTKYLKKVNKSNIIYI